MLHPHMLARLPDMLARRTSATMLLAAIPATHDRQTQAGRFAIPESERPRRRHALTFISPLPPPACRGFWMAGLGLATGRCWGWCCVLGRWSWVSRLPGIQLGPAVVQGGHSVNRGTLRHREWRGAGGRAERAGGRSARVPESRAGPQCGPWGDPRSGGCKAECLTSRAPKGKSHQPREATTDMPKPEGTWFLRA